MNNKNILICGAGIAGLTLAYWLKKYSFNPTVVEIKNDLPGGGYMIDFWGTGFEVAERMHLKSELAKEHYNIPDIDFVDKYGERKGALSIYKMRKLLHFRHFSLLRSGLAKVLFESVKNNVEFIWNNSIEHISQDESKVKVILKNNQHREFDLVIGADGLHSKVRELIFGGEEQFEKYLGYYTASYTINNYLNKDHIFYSFSVPDKQIGMYSVAENKLATFFVFQHNEKFAYNHHNEEEAKAILREQFKNVGWECGTLLARMVEAPDFYFDAVSQIYLDDWSKGRLALVGDACQCVSLAAGQGSALAMAGAYILAGELKLCNDDYTSAFNNYHSLMKEEIAKKQEMALKFAASFIPKTRFGIWLRNKVANLMFLPFISKWFIKKFLLDSLKLKEY